MEKAISFFLTTTVFALLVSCGENKNDFITGEYMSDHGGTAWICKYNSDKLGIVIEDRNYNASVASLEILYEGNDTFAVVTPPKGRKVRPVHESIIGKHQVNYDKQKGVLLLWGNKDIFYLVKEHDISEIKEDEDYIAVKALMTTLLNE